MKAEARLEELGLALPPPMKTPPGLVLSFFDAEVEILGG